MKPRKVVQKQEAAEAVGAEWVARRDAGLSAREEAELEGWLVADPRHPEILARFDRLWHAMGRPRRTGDSVAIAATLASLGRRRRARGMAVGMAGAALVAIGAFSLRPGSRPAALPQTATNRVVDLVPQRTRLSDGSILEYTGGTELKVDFDGTLRLVVLNRGEAHFQVAKDATRPFVVEVAGVAVRAVGTEFNVQLGTKSVEVLVTEGRVTVNQVAAAGGDPAQSVFPGAPGPFAFVDAGNRIVIPVQPESSGAGLPQAVPISPSERDQRLAWRSPRVEFSGAPLSEVAKVLNERNRTQLVIESPSVAAVKLSGLFRADDIETLLRMLEAGFDIRAERRGENELVLKRDH